MHLWLFYWLSPILRHCLRVWESNPAEVNEGFFRIYTSDMGLILSNLGIVLRFILRFLYESLSLRELPPSREIKSRDQYAMTITIHFLVTLANNFKIFGETIFS